MMNECKCYWLIYKHFKSIKKTFKWFRTHNPLLGVTPFDMLTVGRSEKLLRFIENQLEENEPPDELDTWDWPFLRTNFNGDKEYECPHGVGHGGIHGCCGYGCCAHKSYKRKVEEDKKNGNT